MRSCFLLFMVISLFTACSPKVGGIDEPLTKNSLYDINRKVISQQFDFDKEGNVYYVELTQSHRQFLVNIWRISVDKLNRSDKLALYKGDSMSVIFAGHPTGFAIEDTPDGPNVWISNYASKQPDKHYWQSQTISRMKYIPNSIRMPDDKDIEHFWLPHRADINVALDTKHDLVAFSFYYMPEDEKKK